MLSMLHTSRIFHKFQIGTIKPKLFSQFQILLHKSSQKIFFERCTFQLGQNTIDQDFSPSEMMLLMTCLIRHTLPFYPCTTQLQISSKAITNCYLTESKDSQSFSKFMLRCQNMKSLKQAGSKVIPHCNLRFQNCQLKCSQRLVTYTQTKEDLKCQEENSKCDHSYSMDFSII